MRKLAHPVAVTAIISIPLAVFIGVVFNSQFLVSEGIFAITALLIVWYALETHLMKNELINQNELATMPCVIIEENNQQFSVTNNGNGPALNVNIENVQLDEYDELIFPSILFLAKNASQPVKPRSKAAISLIDEHIHVYWKGLYGSDFIMYPKVTYEDLTGRKYETVMKVGRGAHEIVRVGKIGTALGTSIRL